MSTSAGLPAALVLTAAHPAALARVTIVVVEERLDRGDTGLEQLDSSRDRGWKGGPPGRNGAASCVLLHGGLRLKGTDDPAFVALKAEYADVLGGVPPGMPTPLPRSRPVKRLAEVEPAGLRTQLVCSAHGFGDVGAEAGRVVAHLLRPPGRGLDAISPPAVEPAVEPLPHIDAFKLFDGARGSRFFNKLDLAISYHQLRVRAADRWKTSFRSGEFGWV